MSLRDGRMISSRRPYTSSSGTSPFIAASVSRTISGLPPARTSMPSMVTSLESTSKKMWRYLLRNPLRRLATDNLQQVREPLQKMIRLRGHELFARRGAGRDDGDVEAAVPRGADVDRHVADEQRVGRIAGHRVEREQQVPRLRLARAGEVGADDRREVARELEKVEDLLREKRRLVRADRHLHFDLREPLQRRLDVRQHLRFAAAHLVVARFERGLHAARDVRALERALQQPLDPVA